MDPSYYRSNWANHSTLEQTCAHSAYAHLSQSSGQGAPQYPSASSYMGSPASTVSSIRSSPSPSSPSFPRTPTTPSSHGFSSSQWSPSLRKRDAYGSPLGSPTIYDNNGGYPEYDLSSRNPSQSNDPYSTFSSVLCPQYPTSQSHVQPQTPFTYPGLLAGPRGPDVPQTHYSTHFKAGNSPKRIQFRVSGSSELGCPMRLLLGEFATDAPLHDPEGAVFGEDVASTITLRIWWPGYDLYPRRLTMRKASGLLNRIDVAIAITECFRNFVEEAQPRPSDNTTTADDLMWRVGHGGIYVQDLVLLSLYQVSKGSFQADVRLERPIR